MDLPPQLQNILPCGYSYKLKKWIPSKNSSSHFETNIFTNVYTEEEAQEWWQQLNLKSKTTMRVKATCPKIGKVNSFKVYLRCLHQGRPERAGKVQQTKSSKRNTNCPAGMIIAIRRHIKYSRSKLRDPVDPVHPCEIKLSFIHNHSTSEGDSLKVRPVSKHTENKLVSFFKAGHSPASALEMLKMDLKVVYGHGYERVSMDRSLCPDKGFCYRLYIKHFGKEYSCSEKNDLADVLREKVKFYNDFLGESCLASALHGMEHAIAVCTPLMKRVHSFPHCDTVVFVETYESTKEQGKYYVILLFTLTAAGGLPLGCVLTTNNTIYSWKLGLQLLRELLPSNAFSCKEGPVLFLTDNSDVQMSAFQEVWPDSNVYVCSFRLLQHLWKWLWNEKNNVQKDHRLYLLYVAKTIVFASGDSEIDEKYQMLCSDNIASHYPMYLQILKTIWEKRQSWETSALQQHWTLNRANNYYEAAARVLKDKVIEKARTFNLLQLLHFLVTHIDSFYRAKLQEILDNKLTHIFYTHYSMNIPNDLYKDINQVTGNYYLVPMEQGNDVYTVDPELNVCSCTNGITGSLCFHQYLVHLKMPSEVFKVHPFDSEIKRNISYVIHGTNNSPPSQPLAILDSPNISPRASNDPQMKLTVVPQTEDISNFFSDHSNPQVVQVTQISSLCIVSPPNRQEVNSIQNQSCNQDSFVSALSKGDDDVESGGLRANINENESNQLIEAESNTADKNFSSIPTNVENRNGDEVETLEKRMVEILSKFDSFCQRVKDGLRDQPKEFLPALEIMMQNLERKGNSDELLVSSLSFFGVLSAPSLMCSERKRNSKLSNVPNEEIVPKVHGRQMITYGKRRQLDS